MRYIDIHDGERWIVDPIHDAVACSRQIETFNVRCKKQQAKSKVIRKVRDDFKSKGIDFRECRANERDRASWVGRVFQMSNGDIVLNTQKMTIRFVASKKRAAINNLFKEHKLEVLFQWEISPNTFEVAIPDCQDPFKLVSSLSHRNDVVYAVPELVGRGTQRFVPTDGKFDQQWQYKTDKLQAEKAWDISRGEGINLAVIDWGFKVGKEIESAVALAGTLRTDGTFSSELSDLPKADHGTWCANLATGRANNSFAGCGLANLASLILISTNQNGLGSPQDFARAIQFAVDPSTQGTGLKKSQGADVISCSITPPQSGVDHPVIRDALKFAADEGRRKNGTPFFYAVENRDVPIKEDPIASNKYAIAIGRSTKTDRRYRSAYGDEFDFLAPGRNVKVGRTKTLLKTVNGTSYATPLAAAAACLVLAKSKSMKLKDLIKRLQETCDKIGNVEYKNGFHKKYGYGRINALRAVTET